MYKMSSGSILVMCILCFMLSGGNRTPWAPIAGEGELPQSYSYAYAASGTASDAADGDSPRIHAEDRGAAVLNDRREETGGEGGDRPADRSEARGAPAGIGLNANGRMAAFVGASAGFALTLQHAAGFPLLLPSPYGSGSLFHVGGWIVEKHKRVTVHYQFAEGGSILFAQHSRAAGGGVPNADEFRVPGVTAAATIDVIWRDSYRAFAVRASGLPEQRLRVWLRSLAQIVQI